MGSITNFQKSNSSLPKKITPCPLIETIFELRFASDLLGDAIFGLVYSLFRKEYPFLLKLPITQIPAQVLEADPNLVIQPHFRLKSESFALSVGPHILSLSNTGEYVGWGVFSERIKDTFTKIQNFNFIKSTERVSLRYINFFEFDIFSKLNLQINNKDKPLNAVNTNLMMQIPSGRFINTLRIANSAQVELNKENPPQSASTSSIKKKGSILDINTSISELPINFFSRMDEILEDAHMTEKSLFFDLLTDDFIESFCPEY